MKLSNCVDMSQNHFLVKISNLVFEDFKEQVAHMNVPIKSYLHHCQHHN